MKNLIALGMLAALVGYSVPATATPAYHLETEVDLPIVLVGGAVTAGFLFLEEAPGNTCGSAPCDRSKVIAFDRWAAGNYSPAWGTAGDIATAATVLFGPLVLNLRQGLGDGLPDSLVIGEAVLLSSALQVLSSYAVPRARPRAYGIDTPLDERNDANAARSFFSGHTADAVASVVASARTFHKLGYRGLGWMVLGVGLAGSTFVGTARVMSGGHFPSDVLAGAAVGAGFGILMPWMHSLPARVAPMGLRDGGGVMLTGAF